MVTASLAAAAHNTACGANLTLSEVVFAALIGVVIAALAHTFGARWPTLLAILAGGQAATHLALSALEPDSHMSATAAGAMLAAHAGAAAVGGIVLVAAERLYGAVATSVCAFWRAVFAAPAVPERLTTVAAASAPRLFVARVLGASVQRRGPPALVA